MAQKHLHELLKEDQEPFLLKNFIEDRRCQLKRPLPNTRLQLKKRKPISESSSFPGNFCKNACLFSFHDSPDLKKSPLWSPAKSPRKNPNAIFLHIPARTAAMLLEAAVRIQKQSSPKPKTQNKNVGFGLFGSILKRLTHRNPSRKREIEGAGLRVSVKDILRWDSSVGRKKFAEELKNVSEEMEMAGVMEKSASEMGFSCSCNGRLSSVWSESNEEKSLDMETSSSSQSDLSADIDFVSKERQNDDFASCDKDFCTSPFRFVLQRSPSRGSRTPDFSSPATSPSRERTQDKEEKYEGGRSIEEEEEEEEKEQFSPVSILDPPFEDDDDGPFEEDDSEGDHDGDDESSFDHECSIAIVQRAKQQLLHKLRRFEKLAELDPPIELEKRMLEGRSDDEDEEDEDEDEGWFDDGNYMDDDDDEELIASGREKKVEDDECVLQVLKKSRFQHFQGMKGLVWDLIAEEESRSDSREGLVEGVCRRLESWREVESNTIDMMVDLDFRREVGGWSRKNQEEVEEAAMEIEVAIFGLLVEELGV